MRELTRFCRLTEVMLRSGVPVHKIFQVLEETSEAKEREVYRDVLMALEGGASLTRSLATRTDFFTPIFLACTEVAEQSGRLSAVFERMADHFEQGMRLKGKIVAALVYPVALLLVTFLTVLGVVFYVIPQEAVLLDNLGLELPRLTQMLVRLVDVLTNPLVGLLTTVVAVSAFTAFRKMGGELSEEIDHLLFNLPLVGPLIRETSAVLILNGLAILIDTGTTFPHALRKLSSSLGNSYLRANLSACIKEIDQGESPSDSLGRWGILPPVQLTLMRVAEESGSFERACRSGAKILEEDLSHRLEALASLLEPAALLIMAFVVGFVVLSTALPTLQLMQNL